MGTGYLICWRILKLPFLGGWGFVLFHQSLVLGLLCFVEICDFVYWVLFILIYLDQIHGFFDLGFEFCCLIHCFASR